MAFFDTTWYVNFGNGTSTGYYAVPLHAASTAYTAGQIVRQFTTPAVGNERCFVCIVAGTSAVATDATWVLTRGAKTTDGTVTWIECTGATSMNGDQANTQSWAQVKAIGSSVTIGQIIKRNNGASYQVCTLSSGNTGATEPAFSDTAGATTVDGSATWTSLGLVGSFTNGGAPHARLANVFVGGWFASGNTVYVGDNHAETQTTTMSIGASSALTARVLCHNHSGSYPPAGSDITTGATIATTGSTQINITAQGSYYFYGLIFSAGSSSGFLVSPSGVGQVQNWYYFDNCSLQTTGLILLGGGGSAWGIVVLNNTTVKFGSTAGFIVPYFTQLIWQNTGPILATGSAVPTMLLQPLFASSGRFSNVTLTNLDLSQLTGSLFTNASNSSIGTLLVQDCKLNAAMTVTTPINSGMRVEYLRSDSTGTSYKSQRITYEGTETTETTVVRTGGAVDPSGQAQSRKIVTSANAEWLRPYKAEPLAIWNSTVGSAGDPYWNNVKLLLGFNGANGSTGAPGFTDESPAANGTGISGGSHIDTGTFKFGTASAAMTGGGGGAAYPDSTNFALAALPFTIEAWVYPTSLTGVQCFVSKYGSSVLGWVLYVNVTTLSFNISTTGSDNILQMSGGTLVLNAWQHICAEFDGTKYRLYLNGAMVGSSTTLRTIFNPAKNLLIGSNSDGALPYVGWIDEVRITKGVARYANDAGLAVPTAAFLRVAPVGSPVTVTVCGTVQSSALPYNDELWMEVEYQADASSTLGTIVSTTKANLLAGGSPVAVDSSVWVTPGPWLPSQLTTLKLWLKGDSNTGADGSAISTWSDVSGQSNNATGVAGPTVAAANLNGLNVVRLTAASLQYFTLPNFLTGFAAGSVIFVVKNVADPNVANKDGHPIKFGGDTGSVNGDNHYPYSGDSNIYDDFGSANRQTIGNPTASLATWHMTSEHATTNDKRVYINGTLFFSTAVSTLGWRTQPQIGRGDRLGSSVVYYDGWLAEIIFASELLSTSDRQKLEGYLAWKWGIQSVLDVTHPYKTVAPT